LPTLGDARDHPAILKKLPSRWLKNAAVIACIGLLGTTTLSGCAGPQNLYTEYNGDDGNGTEYSGYSNFDISVRFHHGGAGSGPFYTAHLTEQEALGIVRAQLEAAGLYFGATPPGIRASSGFMAAYDVGLDLFDEEKSVAAALISWEEGNRPFSPRGSDLTARIVNAFSQQTNIPIGVFYNPGEIVGGAARWLEGEEDSSDIIEPTEERKAKARPVLYENLSAQVQGFIAWLQAEGILS